MHNETIPNVFMQISTLYAPQSRTNWRTVAYMKCLPLYVICIVCIINAQSHKIATFLSKKSSSIRPYAPLFFTPENFRDTSFLCFEVHDLAQRLQFLQLLSRVLNYHMVVNSISIGKQQTLLYERLYEWPFSSSLWCSTIQFLLRRLQLSSRRIKLAFVQRYPYCLPQPGAILRG